MRWQYSQSDPRRICCPRSRASVGRRRRRGRFRGQPAPNAARGSCDDVERHVRVLEPAELGALPAVDAGSARVEDDVVRPPGDHIDLAVELRDPKAVDDVRAPDANVDGHADRNVDLVRRPRAGARIRDVPEPVACRRRRLRGCALPRDGEVFGSASSVSTNRATITTAGSATPSATTNLVPGGQPLAVRRERRRRRPTASSATTIANTIAGADEHDPPQRRDRPGGTAVRRERRLAAAAARQTEDRERGPRTQPRTFSSRSHALFPCPAFGKQVGRRSFAPDVSSTLATVNQRLTGGSSPFENGNGNHARQRENEERRWSSA